MGTQNINTNTSLPVTTQTPKADTAKPQTLSNDKQPELSADAKPSSTPQTGISNLDSPEGRQVAEQVWVQVTGLQIDKQGTETLKEQLGPQMLAQMKSSFTADAMENEPAPQLASRWSAFINKAFGQGGFDVNSLVSTCIREAYMENTLDLNFTAQKVKFHSAVKNKIRSELTRARKEFAKYSGAADTDYLDPPFLFTDIDTSYKGDGEPTTSQGGQKELAAFQTAQAAATAATNKATTGGGVKLLNAAETAALNPPANGDVFITEDGYRVDVKGTEVRIYGKKDSNGNYPLQTRIWGDPHVDEKSTGSGDDWHFGDDSTFILPDGSKICLNTEETSAGSGIFVVKGVDILSGNDHASVGLSPEGTQRGAGVSDDRLAWDKEHADTKGGSGGVFALQGNGQWAIKGSDGEFRDVSTESWSGYLSSKDVTGQGSALNLNDKIMAAADDTLAGKALTAQANRDTAVQDLRQFAAVTKGDLETYIKNQEEKMNSVGDDAQLANVDLQNTLQKQQQTLQKMSNTSKLLHDTAMAVARKIG